MKSEKELITDLGNGLVLRGATVEDTDAIAKFNGSVHGEENYATFLDIMVREMMSGTHPHIGPEDFTIVEEVETGKIVSSLNLISQTWSYEGIEFGVGRPELVGTLEEYRRKGLVRKQMELVHQWSKDKGHLVQAITGIPWYYRMFGYGMVVNLGGGKIMPAYMTPELKKDEKEKVSIRIAELSDLPFLKNLYEKSFDRSLLSCIRTKEMWKHDLIGRFKDSMGDLVIKIVENDKGVPIGYFTHGTELWGSRLGVFGIEFMKGVSWLDAIPGVFRDIKVTANEFLLKENEKNKKKSEEEKKDFKPKELHSIFFRLGEEHPVFDIFPNLFPKKANPYAWYIRLENLSAFLKKIKPVLEKRIANSYIAGITIDVNLNFYTDGIELKIQDGKLSSIKNIENSDPDKCHASFPDHNFLHILFGYRDLDEVTASRADCFINNKFPETNILLKTLFPKKQSSIWPIE